jgi:hypothetical protein
MIYCKLLSKDGQLLRYAIGGVSDDLTGEIEVNKDDLSYHILKEPKNSFLYYRHIDSMLARCKKDFGQGVFKDKIAHEIG